MEDETMQTTEIAEPTSEETTVTPEDVAPPETNEDVAPDTAEEEAPADTGEEVTASEPAPEELTFMPVFKGEVTPIKASDTDKVTELLQFGLQQQAFAPVFEQLCQLAHEAGAKNVTEYVQNAFDRNEEAHRNAAISAYGQEEGERFYQYQKDERAKNYSRYQQQEATAEREAVQQRNEMLADQFVEMQKEYPEYARFTDVPKEAVKLSIEKGIHLMDAVARYKRAEQKRTAQAAVTAQKAAAAATGSMSDAADNGSDPLWAAYQSGANR